MSDVVTHRLANARHNTIENNEDLRVRYLLNEISEKVWKQQLQRREKSCKFYRELTNLFQMFADEGYEYMIKAATLKRVPNSCTPHEMMLLKELEELRKYVNAQSERIGGVFDRAYEYLNEKFEWRISNRKPLEERVEKY